MELPRMLTLVVEITDQGKAKWIWDKHLRLAGDDLGFEITEIHEGYQIDEEMIESEDE